MNTAFVTRAQRYVQPILDWFTPTCCQVNDVSKQFIGVTPFMVVRDMAKAIAFFSETLGFEVRLRQGRFAFVEREGVGFRIVEETGEWAPPPGNRRFAYYIDVRDVDRVYADLKDRLDLLPEGDVYGPVEQPYGQREFMVVAPDGNLLVYGQAL